MTTTTKKITLATIKSFIKKNQENLYINVLSSFDGMTDACEDQNDGFKKAEETTNRFSVLNNKGIEGAWFVGESRDYFSPYEDKLFTGYKITNACGKFILAIKKA